MKKTFLVLSILGILFHSCEKEIVDDSTQVVRDHLTAENIFNDVGNIVEIGLKENGQSKSFPIYTLMNSDTSKIYLILPIYFNILIVQIKINIYFFWYNVVLYF